MNLSKYSNEELEKTYNDIVLALSNCTSDATIDILLPIGTKISIYLKEKGITV